MGIVTQKCCPLIVEKMTNQCFPGRALKESILGSEGGAELLESALQCENKPQPMSEPQTTGQAAVDRRKFLYDMPTEGRMSDEKIIKFNPGQCVRLYRQ